MRVLVSAVLMCTLIILLLTAGCADISLQKKVGDFGTAFGASPREQKALDWFTTTYGDPRTNNDQPPRFIEPMITTALDADNLPTNKVTTFPADGKSVYFFVIYDNFQKGDPITVTWTYLANGKVVTTAQQQAGGDFGRFVAEFQKPDSGWGSGAQEIVVSGNGTTAKVDFTIGDALQTAPLPYNATTGVGMSGQATGDVTPQALTLTTGQGDTGPADVATTPTISLVRPLVTQTIHPVRTILTKTESIDTITVTTKETTPVPAETESLTTSPTLRPLVIVKPTTLSNQNTIRRTAGVIVTLHPTIPSSSGGASCSDGIKNGDETDVDCGGSSCPACSAGKACSANSDCAGGSCVAGVCTAS